MEYCTRCGGALSTAGICIACLSQPLPQPYTKAVVVCCGAGQTDKQRISDLEAQLAEKDQKRAVSFEPYSDEIMKEINAIEERYDIELVSIEHHEKWVDEVDGLKRVVEEAVELLRMHQDSCDLRVRQGVDRFLAKAKEVGNPTNPTTDSTK